LDIVLSNDKKEFDRSKVRPAPRRFFFNNELIEVVHTNRSLNLVTVWSFRDQKRKQILYSDFKKMRKRAYTISKVSKLIDRTPMQVYRYIHAGLIDPPVGTIPEWKIEYGGKRSYYSEDYLYVIRDAVARIHRGRPRNDGLITSSVISEQELRYRLGDGILLYTQTSDGRYVPVWNETL
jgi:hypothetical protein